VVVSRERMDGGKFANVVVGGREIPKAFQAHSFCTLGMLVEEEEKLKVIGWNAMSWELFWRDGNWMVCVGSLSFCHALTIQ